MVAGAAVVAGAADVAEDPALPVVAEVVAVDDELLLPPFKALAMIDTSMIAPMIIPTCLPVCRFLCACVICGAEPIFGLSDMCASIAQSCDSVPAMLAVALAQ